MCDCPNLCRVISTEGLDGRHPKDGLRMHRAHGCPFPATVTIKIVCPTEGCKDEERQLCEKCVEQYRRWISSWEYVECTECKRFYDTRDYWVVPPRIAA